MPRCQYLTKSFFSGRWISTELLKYWLKARSTILNFTSSCHFSFTHPLPSEGQMQGFSLHQMAQAPSCCSPSHRPPKHSTDLFNIKWPKVTWNPKVGIRSLCLRHKLPDCCLYGHFDMEERGERRRDYQHDYLSHRLRIAHEVFLLPMLLPYFK